MQLSCKLDAGRPATCERSACALVGDQSALTHDAEMQEVSALLRSDVGLGCLLEAVHDASAYATGVFHVFQEEGVLFHSRDIECWESVRHRYQKETPMDVLCEYAPTATTSLSYGI